ncbi:hypothetical protein KOAAANKH_00815 [Brevundimonas sp. NIBR10]|uniref:fumarylacetoacetase n=1 Tax=Brevundimonas sp. NIBR10 TaxID=3015997 RepID=UPI0022F1CD0E|nr:fumarylacetoacetase [Brevundimonas sp. NIBR10]WGM45950.1 hypothetical protein KOAAANKH_00815 [Brevundimonas sp. NIBR10]
MTLPVPPLTSWVSSARGHPLFPLENLPFGVFSTGGSAPRIGVAIGDEILDLKVAADEGGLEGLEAGVIEACQDRRLNGLMALPGPAMKALRRSLVTLLSDDGPAKPQRETWLFAQALCEMHRPVDIGDYTDFYAGIHHATAAGRLFRPSGDALLPNYRHLPVAYHGRASSVDVSATIARPLGQVLVEGQPVLQPTAKLDYELELAIWMGAADHPGAVDIASADAVVFGYGLLNDWSARDFQRWEAQPLGPFLSKNFATSVSPWIVTRDALAPYRAPRQDRGADAPPLLDYLDAETDRRAGALDIDLEVWIQTAAMRAGGVEPERITTASSLDLYWTPAQMIAHHTVGGCGLNPGDLLGSGTISASGDTGGGCLLERTADGARPLRLSTGETRTYLEDGDEVILRALCRREGCVPIGLGEIRTRVTPAAG